MDGKYVCVASVIAKSCGLGFSTPAVLRTRIFDCVHPRMDVPYLLGFENFLTGVTGRGGEEDGLVPACACDHMCPHTPCSAPPAGHLSALVPALSLSPKIWFLKRFLRDPGLKGPPGEHLPYWDQIPYTRFLFDFW